jgi:hypothetical protein
MLKPNQLSLFATGFSDSASVFIQVQSLWYGSTGTTSGTTHVICVFSTHQMSR